VTRAPYFVDYVKNNILYKRYEQDQINRQGLVVVTSIDPQYQKWAEDIVKQKIDEQRTSKRVSQAAVILLEAKTGEVLACVGGYQYNAPNADGKPDFFNRAFQAQRQVGSAFKPFTYSTAYEQGFQPSMLIKDGPNTEETKRIGKTWPKNSDGTYLGWISMFYALQMSRNAAAVDLITNCTGIEPVIETARKMGIRSNLEAVPSLTLGSAVIRPIEMAEAFDTFPNMGVHIGYSAIKKIYNQDGILIEVDDSKGSIAKRSNQALSTETAWIMVQNMERVVNAGTGTHARVNGVEIAGKTGTCSDFTDAWFVGYSPELVCAVWVGNDDFRIPMKHMFGGQLPADIFHALMAKIYSDQKEKTGEGDSAVERVVYKQRYTQRKFEKPEGVKFAGFGSAVRGSSTGEGDLAAEQAQSGAAGAGGDQGGGGNDDGFYDPWVPPTDPQ
jgi:penicillin-binding protein 1A